MPLIKSVKGVSPKWGKDCWIADNATIVGDVIIGDQCTIWFNAVVRGDVHYIHIGNKVNIQDQVVIHCTYQTAPVEIGNNVSIGHSAIIHGCKIGNNVLIGMGAIIMDDVIIEDNCIIAAGAIVTKNTFIPSYSIFAGIPAKKIKNLSEEQLQKEVLDIAEHYPMYASWYNEIE
ncbi:MAG: 2,3,4,5-tetrahydropyridine-2,6-dicarboxylate N-acetyltransferase [Bacteroidetes bacterium ADurb.Bin035]|nr:MAG: 2,3,4,5-tetrahydropyridine-2,6-dicarboxylate N-acetyltransferase [Bacteroidetes bacterium ADurb.Bin035]HOF07078.1 gamma carbonic anhydrase family protein [Bacteroidales bacterium]HPL02212.1 gamma carbonic anhydrase family protein [Bacteroidales bacterium]